RRPETNRISRTRIRRPGNAPRRATCYLSVDDVDASYRRGIEGGRQIPEPTGGQTLGERNAGFEDALGNHWWVGARSKPELSFCGTARLRRSWGRPSFLVVCPSR